MKLTNALGQGVYRRSQEDVDRVMGNFSPLKRNYSCRNFFKHEIFMRAVYTVVMASSLLVPWYRLSLVESATNNIKDSRPCIKQLFRIPLKSLEM